MGQVGEKEGLFPLLKHITTWNDQQYPQQSLAATPQVSHGFCIISASFLYLGYLRGTQMILQASV